MIDCAYFKSEDDDISCRCRPPPGLAWRNELNVCLLLVDCGR